MIKGKWKILICTIFVTCIFFMASNSIFAAINEDYYDLNLKGSEIYDVNLEKKLSSSVLVNVLGSLIYAVGSLLEWVLGGVFKLITGSSLFPWADSILFNAVPFLDINVFNPSGASLLAVIQESLAGLYYTVLTLAAVFFGLAVMVSAIRLVLTAIAEEKARYKKAIVDWLLGLVMLWGIHFFISFVLYLNEELVIIASTIASEALQDNDVAEILKFEVDDAEAKQIITLFIESQKEKRLTSWAMALQEFLFPGDEPDMSLDDAEKYLYDHVRAAATALQDERFTEYTLGPKWSYPKSTDFSLVPGSKWHIQRVGQNLSWSIGGNRSEESQKRCDDEKALAAKGELPSDRFEHYEFCLAADDLYNEFTLKIKNKNNNLFTNLANYFKETAWEFSDTSWVADKSVIQNALMYAILVVQSLIFFIAYTKRLFYILMLILMAPVVVVFDFFNKF